MGGVLGRQGSIYLRQYYNAPSHTPYPGHSVQGDKRKQGLIDTRIECRVRFPRAMYEGFPKS